MLVQITHHSGYDYSSEVVLGMHKLYLIPQHRPYFRIEHQKFSILPHPEGENFRQDLAGNWYKLAWFSVPTHSLNITGEWIFKLHSFNPFGFIIDQSFEEMGWKNPFFQFSYEERTAFLIPFLSDKSENHFQDYLHHIREKSSGLVDFLVNMTQDIYRNWKHEIRHEQDIWETQFTFSEGRGSCRDISLMQMEMLRELGLATRFVSGYAFNPDLDEGHELHAWLEVFLPGAGWIGLDPSLGLLTDHRYIPLACHPDPTRTLPVQGTYGGISDSRLNTFVDMKLLNKGK